MSIGLMCGKLEAIATRRSATVLSSERDTEQFLWLLSGLKVY